MDNPYNFTSGGSINLDDWVTEYRHPKTGEWYFDPEGRTYRAVLDFRFSKAHVLLARKDDPMAVAVAYDSDMHCVGVAALPIRATDATEPEVFSIASSMFGASGDLKSITITMDDGSSTHLKRSDWATCERIRDAATKRANAENAFLEAKRELDDLLDTL